MSTDVALAAANIDFVRQGVALLDAIDDDAFTRTSPPMYASGVGAHLRHCIDHYHRFLDGHRDGLIDYDARDRDRRLETDRRAARRALADIAVRLEGIAPADVDRRVEVVIDCGTPSVGDRIDPRCPSTVRRELLFLVSHTVHHYALIAHILRQQSVAVPAGFGVAPSTLRHHGGLVGNADAAITDIAPTASTADITGITGITDNSADAAARTPERAVARA